MHTDTRCGIDSFSDGLHFFQVSRGIGLQSNVPDLRVVTAFAMKIMMKHVYQYNGIPKPLKSQIHKKKTIFSSKYYKFVDFWFGWYVYQYVYQRYKL